jgi:hypothetical protein
MNADDIKPIFVDRPLTEDERELTRWILEHGSSGTDVFVDQLERARVKSVCPCGCASIDFAIEGMPDPPAGYQYTW